MAKVFPTDESMIRGTKSIIAVTDQNVDHTRTFECLSLTVVYIYFPFVPSVREHRSFLVGALVDLVCYQFKCSISFVYIFLYL